MNELLTLLNLDLEIVVLGVVASSPPQDEKRHPCEAVRA